MQWLIANMWIAMAVATVLGLLFGFALRGLLVGSKIQKAEVEREIAKTELNQSKAEVEALYAAQRKQKEDVTQSGESDDRLRADLDERDRLIASLGDQLTAVQSELEVAKTKSETDSSVLETAGAAVAGAALGAVLSDDDQEQMTALRDRNAWLEERVGALETDLAAGVDIDPSGQADTTGSELDLVAMEKTQWQADYLSVRVEALEQKLMAQQVAQPVAEPTPEPVAPVPNPEPEPERGQDVDEELAQLRWRNRYLEGRLAYFEEAPEDEMQAEPAEATNVEPLESETKLAEVVDEPAEGPQTEDSPEEAASDASVADETEPKQTEAAEIESPEASEATPEPAAAVTTEEPADVHPSEAMLAELDGKQPVQLERPRDGGDDLTAITGIGPRIGEVLNGLGIWTYSQIAEWESENETWIENHLSFKGRVNRENWVGQAKALLVAA